MANKKYQVFISSTYSDLIEERRKILDILLMADCIPAGMEAFVATDIEQFEVIKKVIDLCDYYVLIIGKRYGSVNAATGLSYTEMEYEYAKQKQIPVLVFAIDDSVDLSGAKVEKETDKIEALKRFRQKAMTNRLASVWKTPDELTSALAIAIMRAKNEIERPGWQRATDYDETTLLRDIMNLQKEKGQLEKELASVKHELQSLTETNGVAFEGCSISIAYRKKTGSYNEPKNRTITRELPELFKIIAMQMLDVSLTETAIGGVLLEKLFPEDSYKYSFRDPQFVKQILNQLKEGNLLYSSWNEERSALFWGLTKKGELVRNEMILIKKFEEGDPE